ncbi:Bifunctional pinoresinol-lariciresinol reductase 1, partial [Dissostichus eleginoides]
MPPKAGRGRRKKLAGKYRTQKRKAEETEDLEVQEDSTESPTSKSKSKPEVGKGDKGKGKAQHENPPPGASYSFTVAQEEAIARWVESNKLLYDMKDKQYKDKALRRQLWEGKAAEYGVDYHSIQKWYHIQRTRFSKLREGQPKKKSQKRSGDGLSSGDEEVPILAEEASENDSDRDKFIRRVFGFMKPHIRRHKKDTPASFKDKLALAETGELAGSDNSTVAGSLADEPREPTKKYTGYPTPRPPSRTGTAAEDRPESPTMEMRVTGASCDLEDRLVQLITREQQVNRATPFCKYLETELDRLHDVCLEPAYEDITTVLNHYQKVSRQFRMREAAESANFNRRVPSPAVPTTPPAEFQPGPSQWPRNPPP